MNYSINETVQHCMKLNEMKSGRNINNWLGSCFELEWEQTLNILKYYFFFIPNYSIRDIKFANTYLSNELSSTESKDSKK